MSNGSEDVRNRARDNWYHFYPLLAPTVPTIRWSIEFTSRRLSEESSCREVVEGGEERVSFESLRRGGNHDQGKCPGGRGDRGLVESLRSSIERGSEERSVDAVFRMEAARTYRAQTAIKIQGGMVRHG